MSVPKTPRHARMELREAIRLQPAAVKAGAAHFRRTRRKNCRNKTSATAVRREPERCVIVFDADLRRSSASRKYGCGSAPECRRAHNDGSDDRKPHFAA